MNYFLRLRPDTLRECALVTKRATVGLLPAEVTELLALQRAAQRSAEDAKAEHISESRSVAHHYRTNPHE